LFKAIDFYYPSKIFENLYIGSAYQAANPHIIKDLNIDIVINLTPRAPFATKTTRNYRFDIEDEEGQNIIVVLKKTYGIITNYSQKNILVHCNKGQSRSGSVILYYVCKRLSLSLKEGYDFCKKRHRIIRPNPGFLNQIQDLLR
jgi:protein-tyrosine phosphatase